MAEELPPVARHEAVDRFGKVALRTAQRLTGALRDQGDTDPVVLRTDGPHRSIDGLAALIDAALAEDDAPEDDAPEDAAPEGPTAG